MKKCSICRDTDTVGGQNRDCAGKNTELRQLKAVAKSGNLKKMTRQRAGTVSGCSGSFTGIHK
jgi:hypothetical protein